MAEDLSTKLQEKIDQAELLLQTCDEIIEKGVEGGIKLKRKVQAELDFLKQLQQRPNLLRPSHIASTNLTHLNAMCMATMAEPNVTAVLAPFPRLDGRQSTIVDVVADGGNTWIKVVARSAKGLHFAWAGEGGYQERGIIDQAYDYVSTAIKNPFMFKTPKIVFIFTGGITQPIIDDLKNQFAITCRGHIVPVDASWNCSDNKKDEYLENGSDIEDSDNDQDEAEESLKHCTDGVSLKHPIDDCLTQHNWTDENDMPLNLDVTALIAYVSALTNGDGAQYRFREPLLDEQASWERQRPALPQLKKFMDPDVGRRLICCRTAHDSFMDILKTVGGEGEKERAISLLQRVQIFDDRLTDRTAKLQLGQRVKDRSKVIFGTGDYYKAITLTANRKFVHAAENQGVRLAVILHESRALSEQKQQHAVPLISSSVSGDP